MEQSSEQTVADEALFLWAVLALVLQAQAAVREDLTELMVEQAEQQVQEQLGVQLDSLELQLGLWASRLSQLLQVLGFAT